VNVSQISEQISWHVVLAVRSGRRDDFRALNAEMVAAAQGERGVLNYERFASDDGQTIHIYERYADSVAATAHLRNFAKTFGERFGTMVDRTQFTVFGDPSAELRALLIGYGAAFFSALK
jgi:quinol monooxygenase YgiN